MPDSDKSPPAIEPMTVSNTITNRRDKLTPQDRIDIREALLAGEKQSKLAEKYGVTKTSIYHLNVKLRAEFGDAPAEKIANRTRKITRDDWDRFVATIRKTTPEKEGLEAKEAEEGVPWDIESATRFGTKYFNRVPPPARLISALNRAFPMRTRFKKPAPPERMTRESISPDLRANKRFVEYVTSEIYWKIQQKEYEDALEHYNEYIKTHELPETPEIEDDDEDIFDGTGPLPDIPGRMLKSHAPKGKKGQAFTKPKRRKKSKPKKRKK